MFMCTFFAYILTFLIPAFFLFQLTQDEKGEVVANCDYLGNLKFSKVLSTNQAGNECEINK